jgi:hypothetical protein
MQKLKNIRLLITYWRSLLVSLFVSFFAINKISEIRRFLLSEQVLGLWIY